MCHHTQLPWAQAWQDYAALARHLSAGVPLAPWKVRPSERPKLDFKLFYYFESPSSVCTLSLSLPLSLSHLAVSFFFWPSLSLH